MENDKLEIAFLAQVQALETLWAYYYFSDGKIFSKECRDATILFLTSYEELAKSDPLIMDDQYLGIAVMKLDINDLLNHLKEWAEGEKNYPYDSRIISNANLQVLLTGLKILMVGKLNLPPIPMHAPQMEHISYSAQVVRWQAHLPKEILKYDPSTVIELASKSRTIAVVGDIRRSQDLMTYANNPKDYSKRMATLISKSRDLIEKHLGFFDKFTGDGFIVYFNEAIAKFGELNYVDCFLNFVSDELNFAVPFFKDWERSIRKRPIVGIGLAIGADIGKVTFEDIQDHLVAVGEPIVWADRMVSAAKSHEVLVNNLLHTTLENWGGISFEEREGQTKAGEAFLAQALIFTPQVKEEIVNEGEMAMEVDNGDGKKTN